MWKHRMRPTAMSKHALGVTECHGAVAVISERKTSSKDVCEMPMDYPVSLNVNALMLTREL